MTGQRLGAKLIEINGLREIKALRKPDAARGLEIRAKWAGPTDKHLKRWDAPTQKTLDDARVLLSRGTEARQTRREQLAAIQAEFPITVTKIPWRTS